MATIANTAAYGFPIQNVAQNVASTDGNNFLESSNTQILQHLNLNLGTTIFSYPGWYLYAPLGIPRQTNSPNTGINTRIPFTP